MKILLRLAIILLLGLLLKIAPNPYAVTQDFHGIQTALAEDDFQTVAENLADIAERLPWRVDLWESAGNFAFRAGDKALARYAYEKADEADALSQAGTLSLGDVYLSGGEDALAEETWSILEDSPDALRRLSTLHKKEGDIPATITDLENLLALGNLPDEEEIRSQLGLLLAAHNPIEALPYLQAAEGASLPARALTQALSDIPADAEPAYMHIVAGQTLASLNEWNLAQHAFGQSVAAREDYAEAWAYLGEALQHSEGNDAEALESLQKALALDPDSFSANMFTALYWRRQGELNQALSYYETAAELEPDLPEVYVETGQTLAALGELSKAEAKYKEAVALAPQQAEYYHLLAQFCVQYHHKVRELGLPAARQGMWLNDQDPASWDVMGLVMLELEDEFNAERLFLRAIDLNPRYAMAHLHLGMVYLYQEENTRAYYHLNQALNFATNPAVIEHAVHLLGYFE